MIKVYDFLCPNDHIFELFVSEDSEVANCPECDLNAKRIISGGNFKLDAMSGDYPTATAKWAKHHERAANGKN
jgi:Zn finger protein HypA/HybF involved in hydrogenase expression